MFLLEAWRQSSRCRVGASAPRCRVVPSVTLGTGVLNSPVRGALDPPNIGAAELLAGFGKYPLALPSGNDVPLSLLWAATIIATPFPNVEKPGKKRLQPQKTPPGNLIMIARAATMKPNPINRFMIPFSRLGSISLPRLRRRRERGSSGSEACGNCPESACGIRLMFAPQTRQKLAPSTFWAAHLGQNIRTSDQLLIRTFIHLGALKASTFPRFSVATLQRE